MVVGVPFDNTAAIGAGRAYVYDLASTTPTVPVARLTNPSPAFNDWFGLSVAADGTTVRFADDRRLQVDAVIWATGYRSDYSWIHAPTLNEEGLPQHRRGVTDSPGLYFLGMHNQYSRGSSLIYFVREDAAYIVDQVRSRAADGGAATSQPA